MKKNFDYDILIAGGGLSGCSLALFLGGGPYRIAVMEKDREARHKVCGEYLSNEIRPLLEGVLPELDWKSAANINTFQLTDSGGNQVDCPLPLGGFGLSRKLLEGSLREQIDRMDIDWIHSRVTAIAEEGGGFRVESREGPTIRSRMVVGALGKHSLIDHELGREFVGRRSKWMGIKAHYQRKGFPSNRVSLHLVDGGYAGLSAVEDGIVNLCGLYHADAFRELDGPEDFFESALRQNPALADFLEGAEPLFERPLTISNIFFGQKDLVANGILMCGDSAGLIHPLSGNGMAMSVHAAYILSDLLKRWLKGHSSREQLYRRYRREWTRAFARRMKAGRLFQRGFTHPELARFGMAALVQMPALLPALVRQTHGKPIEYGLRSEA